MVQGVYVYFRVDSHTLQKRVGIMTLIVCVSVCEVTACMKAV